MSFDLPEPSYDEVPYTSQPHWRTHPDRLATLGRLFGLPTPHPTASRILEIGCASGANLVPVAALYPGAVCMGIDPSELQIAKASALAAPYANATFYRASLSEVDASWGSFDYILAHGVWSWVSAEDRERLLALIAARLSPNGVAFVSYNVLPGWHFRGGMRDLMRFHAMSLVDPMNGAAAGRHLLQLFAESHGDEPSRPYARALQKEARTLANAPDAYLWHDHLSAHNHPVYFVDFARHASAYGLDYLSEAVLSTTLRSRLPERFQGFLETVPDRLRAEQYLDFYTGRAFRWSLLVHERAGVDREIRGSAVNELHAACRGAVQDGVLTLGGAGVDLPHAAVAEAVSTLCAAWPETRPVAALTEQARTHGDDAPLAVLGALLSLYANDAVELWRTPCRALATGALSPYVRDQLRRGERVLVNARHQTVPIDDDHAAALLAGDPAVADRAAQASLLVSPKLIREP